MSSFSVSTDKILESGLGSSSSSISSQSPLPSSPPPENRRLKIIAAIVFVLLALVAAAALVGIYLSQPKPPPEIFTIKIKDVDEKNPATLKIKYDKTLKVEYTMTTTVESPRQTIFILKDFRRALVAHKDFRQGLCLVGRLNDTEDSAKQRAKTFKNKQMQVAATENFLILNGTVHSEVLEFAAGWRIANYCATLPAHWVVKFDPITSDAFNEEMKEENEVEIVTVKENSVVETTGQEEQLQILTDSAKDTKDVERLPPEDPVLIQKAEDIAVLEEKTSILAEKLEIPEETIRPNQDRVEKQLALLEEEEEEEEEEEVEAPTTARKLIPSLFAGQMERIKVEERREDATENENLFAERLESQEKLLDGVNDGEEIKSSADEKSTVMKAPHEHFALGVLDVSSTTYASRSFSQDVSVSTSSDSEFHSRRKRSSCEVVCWYYIRKFKGYKRCFYKCN